ncbi:transaldolase family protein [Trueperella pecoris]|uniref:Transaldolase n=1 Tax=Trueperella pecoris TaxID=2733571 RepID=A0A7M1QWR0_9ACTO|nr:transaldolase family protein [Trueperella pecoris]QOQ39589.1 transaldolase [Trueperella pecoris]QOR45785.1 transaldolase [Trueperella pecoris]
MSATTYTPGPLLTANRQFPTVLWNDSSDIDELRQSISFGGVGATCNPVIAYNTISKYPEIWTERIRKIAADNPTWSESQIGWQAVKDMSVEAAKLFEEIFDETNGHDGRLSVQTDPRLHRDAKALADQAEEFHHLAKNIIVKIPATKSGIEAIEMATERGVSVNVTVSFSVPQAVTAAEAIQRGLAKRESAGHDVSQMSPVVTIMVGRLDDWLKSVVKRDKIFIDPSALEWAGVAAVKRAYSIFNERGLRPRLLVAAFRNVLQWSEFQGGDLVVSPPFSWQKIVNDSDYEPVERMSEDVDPHYITELQRIPDFNRAYDVDGMSVEEFEAFGPTVRTLRQFLAADNDLDMLIRDVLIPAQ